jgi:RNA polymerase sigma-70 factor (ECF subfamily)
MTDGELVRCVVAGDTAAYGELARRWFRRILAFCQSRVLTQDAEDLTQDVLIRGYTHLSSLTNSDQFGPWLRGIAHNICVDWCRTRQRQSQQIGHRNGSAALTEIAASAITGIHDDERTLVASQLAALPEELREVILLRYYESLTYDDMSQWLGVSRATVNERLAKARALLRLRLAKLRSDV